MTRASTAQTWVGIDPGSRTTGIVARNGNTLAGYLLIDRATTEPDTDRPGLPTMRAIVEAVAQLTDPATCGIAIEDLLTPNPHVNRKNGNAVIAVGPMLDVREIIGYLRCVWPDAVLVRPDRHGSMPLASYPDALVSPRERAHAIKHRTLAAPAPQSATLRHARSAWDVAGAAAIHARIEASRLAQATGRRAVPRPTTTTE
jgi:hypothetical protein